MRRTLTVLGAEAVVATALAALDVLPVSPGLAHAAALPPLDLAFDLRLIAARAPSYRLFAVGVACSLLVRSAAFAAIARMRWRRAFIIESALAVPLAIASVLSFASVASLYHWFAWIAIGITLIAALVVARAPVYLLALIAAGAVLPPVAALLVVAACGAWFRTRRRPPAAPAVLAALMLVSQTPAPTPSARNGVLLLVPGVDSATGRGPMFDLNPRTFGFGCPATYYFSYRGVGEGESPQAPCPIRLHRRYRPGDTHRPFREAVRALAEQAEAVRAVSETDHLVLAGHSQGGWIAWRAVAEGRIEPPVTLVLIATHPDSPLGYPPRGRDGPGRVGADGMRVLYRLTDAAGLSFYDPDSSMARGTAGRTGRVARLLSAPLPKRTKVLAVHAALDAPLLTGARRIEGATHAAVVATHTGVVTSPETAAVVKRFLSGARYKTRPPDLWARILDKATQPFGPPPGLSIRFRS